MRRIDSKRLRYSLEFFREVLDGTGQYDLVRLSDEAQAYLEKHNCRTKLAATPDAIRLWNEAKGKVIGLFHVTC